MVKKLTHKARRLQREAEEAAALQQGPPMSAEAYRQAIAKMSLTQGEAGYLFGGKSETSGKHWALTGAPFHIALLFKIMRVYGITVPEIEKLGQPYRRTNGV